MRIQFLAHSRNPQKAFLFFSSSMLLQTAGALNLPLSNYFLLSLWNTSRGPICGESAFLVPSILQRPLPESAVYIYGPPHQLRACVQRAGDPGSSPPLSPPHSASSKVCRAPWQRVSSHTQLVFSEETLTQKSQGQVLVNKILHLVISVWTTRCSKVTVSGQGHFKVTMFSSALWPIISSS